KCIQTFLNESTKKPISHIAVCPSDVPLTEPRLVAINSYDNVMRVYDRGAALPTATYSLVHALKGYKNRNWPIRSSFYRFREPVVPARTGSTEELVHSDINSRESDKLLEAQALLATGSADQFIYVYSLGQEEVGAVHTNAQDWRATQIEFILATFSPKSRCSCRDLLISRSASGP
ncbi:hypothetical protein HDU91_001406, partial [Kappamyces sp. JEL0680]